MSIYKRASGRYAVMIDADPQYPFRVVEPLSTTKNGRRRNRIIKGFRTETEAEKELARLRKADAEQILIIERLARGRRTLGTYATKKEAEKAERDALSARDRGVDLEPGKMTIGEVVDRYLADRATRCGAKTIQEYESIAARYIVPQLGPTLLCKLRPAHVSAWQADIGRCGGRDGSAIAPKPVFHARSLLYGALRWAVKMQLVATNACSFVDAPTVRRSEAKALTSEEITRLLAVAEPTRWGNFVTLALAIGARRGELLAIRWSSVDAEARTVTIGSSLSQTKAGGISLKGTKTDAVRTVPLSRLALDALGRQRASQAADKLRAGGNYIDAGFVFADELGSSISPMAATSAYARLARKAKISSTRLHDTRHTAATTLLTAGVDVRTTAGILGHASPTITLSTYAHLMPEAQRDAIDRLGLALERIKDMRR